MSDPDALARAVADGMFAKDRASRALGMRVVEAKPGCAKLAMTVRADMVNGHDICHGGLIFALADSAFAFACNSGNVVTVALSGTITFLAPGRLGDQLIAEAVEVHRGRTTGVYDVGVRTEDGRMIATFRGNSFQLGGEVVPGLGGPVAGRGN